jgi:tripartite-type tricarboxylate transporter receptor subunit TctC
MMAGYRSFALRAAACIVALSAMSGARVQDYPNRPITLVTNVVKYASMLVWYPGLPAQNVAELTAYGKAHPNALTGGHGGIGGQAHLGTLMFAKMAGAKIEFVSDRGEGPVPLT